MDVVMAKIVYIELYRQDRDECCGDPLHASEALDHVVATTEDDRKIELSVTADQVPAPGTPERAAFEENPPVLRDVTGDMGLSCGAWQHVRDL